MRGVVCAQGNSLFFSISYSKVPFPGCMLFVHMAVLGTWKSLVSLFFSIGKVLSAGCMLFVHRAVLGTWKSLFSLFFSHSCTPRRSTPALISPSLPRRLISWSGFTTSFCSNKDRHSVSLCRYVDKTCTASICTNKDKHTVSLCRYVDKT